MPLTSDEAQRYLRQTILPELGDAGQERLKASSILCIGTGGLGSPALLYLAAAGIGKIGLIDPDHVDLSNLHRQILHDTDRLGSPKLESARDRLQNINPHVEIILHPGRFTAENALDLLSPYDALLDGSDNFPTRFAANDAAFFLKKPLIHGAIFQFEGQTTVFAPHLGGPCYRCLLPEPPPSGSVPSCAEAGVLGVLPGIIGSLQAMEAIKLLAGIGTPPLGRLTHYRALNTHFREIKIKPDPACPLCGENATITAPVAYDNDSCPMSNEILPEITTLELRQILAEGFEGILLDVREQDEYFMAHIEGSQLLPLSGWPAAADHLPKDAKYLVHCAAGIRSARAGEWMLQNGFTDVTNVAGGMKQWLQEE